MHDDDGGEPRPVTTEIGYAAWAGHYDAHDNPMTAMAEHVLANGAAAVRGARVVEVGCGTGRNAVAARSMGCAAYVGVDSSREMLAVARGRQELANAGVRFVERDLRDAWWTDLGAPGEGFDVGLVSLVLEHFEEVEGVLAALGRVVRPGGLLWILEIHPALQRSGTRAHVTVDGQTLALPSFAHDAGELVGAMETTGWAPVAMTEWYATEELAARSAKLARYLGRPVLLEARARRSWSGQAGD